MVVEEFVVIVRGSNGRGRRQFTYLADPKKKPNSESVLRDFRLDSQIQDERDWRLCTVNGREIRWLADYADRVLVLEPISKHILLPKLGFGLGSSQSSKFPFQRQNSPKRHQLSGSVSVGSLSSTPKLPSLSTASSSNGSNLYSSSFNSNNKSNEKKPQLHKERVSRVNSVLLNRSDANGTRGRAGNKRERSR